MLYGAQKTYIWLRERLRSQRGSRLERMLKGHYESENTAKVGGNLIYIYHDSFYRNVSSSDDYYCNWAICSKHLLCARYCGKHWIWNSSLNLHKKP